MQAIILAGGKGTRLAERLAGKPKPLVDVAGTPLLERQIRALESHGVDDVIVLVNHAADQIRAFFDGREFAARIRIVDDGEPRGTAGAVLASLPMMARRALIVYGDTLFDIDIEHMVAAHEASNADATLLLHPNDHPNDSHLVALDEDGFISGFHAPPHAAEANLRNLVNAAFYVFERKALLPWRDLSVPTDFGNDLFPAMLAAEQRLFGYVSAEYIKDVGTPARLDKAECHLKSGLVERSSRRVPQSAVFMDRDGTLNRLAGHISSPNAIELIPDTGAALRRLNDAGLRTVLITNQPVIARGDCDLATLDRIHGRLERLLAENGGYLDRIYFCPHHPHSGYAGEVAALKVVCTCRKPATGMIEAAIEDMHIDRNRSWMVGDSDADMLAADRAGLLSVWVRSGDPLKEDGQAVAADMEADDFSAAVDFILGDYPRLQEIARRYVGEAALGDIFLVDEEMRGLASVLRNELRAQGRPARTVRAAELPDVADVAGDTILVVNWPRRSPAPESSRMVTRVSAAQDRETQS